MNDLQFPISGYRLRVAKDDDKKFVMNCMKESVLLSVPNDESRLSDFWVDDILDVTSVAMDSGIMRSEMFILDDIDGERIGIMWIGISRDQFTCEETGYLLGLYVTEGSRRKGLGRALVSCAEDWCRMNNIVSLTLNVGSNNGVAKDVYSRLGFKERSTVLRKRLYRPVPCTERDCGHSETASTKSLNQ